MVLGGTQIVVSMHGLAVVLGVGAGALLAVRRAHEPASVVVAVTAVAAASLVGAHALFALLHGGGGAFWRGGLASTGGVAAGLAAAFVVARATRRPAGELLDALVPAGLLALAIGRVGCFLAGCCYGRPTALPWGVVFPALGPPARHPLQLYSAAGDLLLVVLLPQRAPADGAVARRGCIAFGCLRVVLETLRDPATTDLVPGGWLTLPQAWALLLALVAAACAPGSLPCMPPSGGALRMADEKTLKDIAVWSGHREMTLEDIAVIQPGLGRLMPEIGARTWKVFYAAKARNWPLARFEAKEIRGLMELAAFTRPKYEENLNQFLVENWKPLEEAIAKEDFPAVEAAFHKAVEAANAYHELRDKPYIKWKLPDTPPPDLDLTPRRK